MTARLLFPIPNALDTRRPLPLPLGPTVQQFLIFLGWLFGSLAVTGLDIWAARDIWSDLLAFSGLCALAMLVITLKLSGHALPYWLWCMNRASMLRIAGRISWGVFYNADAARSIMGVKRKGTVVLSGTWARVLYSNARVLPDGVLDVTGIPLLPRVLRTLVSLLKGQPPFRQVIDVGEAMLADLEDADSQMRLARIRSTFWFRLRQHATAYGVVQPLDPERIAYCAGPEEAEARKLAEGKLEGQHTGLSERHNYLVLKGATVWFLKRNVRHAQAILANAGRSTRVLSSDELDEMLSAEWGRGRNLPLEIGPDFVKLGGRAMCSFLITGLERNVPLDWVLAFLDGSIRNARMALFQQPVTSSGPFGALAQLTWRVLQWRAANIGFDPNQYDNAIADAERVQAEIREPSGALHRFGIVLTVPEEQREEAEQTLKSQYVTWDGYHSAWQRQDVVAKASLPIGIDAYIDRASTDSATLGLCTPWTGGGLWRPPIDGKPTPILLGYSLATAEPVGWFPFDRRDTAGQEAWNAFIWGMMGDGKTTLIQTLTRRICQPHPKHYLAELKPRCLVIDHKADLEYSGLIADLGGEYIVASDWSDVRGINVEQKALGINLSRIHPRKRGTFAYDLLRQLMDALGRRPLAEPWPGVLDVDEMHILALTEEGRWMISETGKMARAMWLSVIYGTQDMDDVLRRDETAGVGADGLVAAAIKNASFRCALRQPHMTRQMLRERVGLSEAECDFLIYMGGEDGGEVRSSRGKCLIWAHGRKVPAQIVPLGRELQIFAMDPQVRLALFGTGVMVPERDAHASATAAGDAVDELLGGNPAGAVRRRSVALGARRARARRYRRS